MKIYRDNLNRIEGPQCFRAILFDIGVNDLGDPETPIELELVVHQQGEDLLLKGLVRTNLNLICDRCLGKMSYSVDGAFDIWLVPERPPDLKADEENILIFPPHQQEVDLSRVVAEAIYIELPQNTLCREDCKGLCSTCGADLNKQPCECATRQTDERWSALLTIKEKLEE